MGTVVVDCESGPVRLGLAGRVAAAAGGRVVTLDELTGDAVAGVAHRPIRRQLAGYPATTGISSVTGPAASPAIRAMRSATASGSVNSSKACTRA